jgi:hypothetical protein
MNEAAAREVVLVRAIEARDADRALLSDADREWATRAAAEVEGDGAPADRFLARRAALALERIRARNPSADRALRAFAWHGWIGPVLAGVAFALGIASNQLGPAQRVNVLAFPLLALLAWNLAMYVVLAARFLLGWLTRRRASPLRGLVARLAQGLPARVRGGSGLAAAIGTFTGDWAKLAAPLATARAAGVLHWAAAALAIGAVAGMYLRGLAFEYRAGWESTFLDAAQVRALLAFALAPGTWLTGIAVPDAAHLEGIRFSASGAGENAAPWIHLYAATAAVVVLAPRALLAVANGLAARRWTARFPLPLDDAYYARLLRSYGRGAAQVHVVPYSYQAPPAAVQGLAAVVARALGPHAELVFADAVAYGNEDAIGDVGGADVVIALFALAATPERENQAAFAAALAQRVPAGSALVAMVDEADFARRFAQQPERVAERRAAWRDALEPLRVEAVFANLAEPDLAAVEAALTAVLDRAAGTPA